jgi:epoxyqueuosine reductase
LRSGDRGALPTLGLVRRPEPIPTLEEVRDLLGKSGITHVGVTTAEVLDEAREALFERREAGLHAEMGFTYRDPERSTDPLRAVPGARSVIVAAKPYLTEQDPARPDGSLGPQARVGRYAWVDHYAPLRSALREASRRIRRSDHRAVAFADDNSVVDRAVAHRAGLGWYGKNANLLLPGAGSWFVLGSIVTTAPYEPTPGPAPDGCGTCTRCIDDCPTGAIISPGVIDANLCISWILQRPGSIPAEHRSAIGDRIYGCDDCQDACPISVRLGRRNTIALDPTADAWVDAIALLESDDDGIEARYGHWYVTDRDFRWVRRNALVVIGNVGDPADARVRQVLEHYRAHIDPILAEHAAWAADRLAHRSWSGADT